MDIDAFQNVVWEHFNQNQRSMPWREEITDYKVLVSEIMLQQTQVSRVIEKYLQFLSAFPTVAALANADLDDVLRIWIGLGYNRRAKFLWQAAQMIIRDYSGRLPSPLDFNGDVIAAQKELTNLPGVGINTAGAILAYVHNVPVVFVETNIRTVFMHHYFSDATTVSDSEILAHVSLTLDTRQPRNWYWALMDYGAHLKATQPKHLHRAKSHTRQTPFEGSFRQLRGKILRRLATKPESKDALHSALGDPRTAQAVEQLCAEGLIHACNNRLYLGAA